jgi:hypothetical protein
MDKGIHLKALEISTNNILSKGNQVVAISKTKTKIRSFTITRIRMGKNITHMEITSQRKSLRSISRSSRKCLKQNRKSLRRDLRVSIKNRRTIHTIRIIKTPSFGSNSRKSMMRRSNSILIHFRI